jgi:hypothetical protein
MTYNHILKKKSEKTFSTTDDIDSFKKSKIEIEQTIVENDEIIDDDEIAKTLKTRKAKKTKIENENSIDDDFTKSERKKT